MKGRVLTRVKVMDREEGDIHRGGWLWRLQMLSCQPGWWAWGLEKREMWSAFLREEVTWEEIAIFTLLASALRLLGRHDECRSLT